MIHLHKVLDRTTKQGECLIWTGCKLPTGYGKAWNGASVEYAHRMAYRLANGIEKIAPDLVVMHSCDNPSCVNPAHLSLGTKAQNSADMRGKGRSRAGERHPLHRLKRDDANTIRTRVAAGETQRSLAREYGVSFQHVSAIVAGKAW